MYANHKYPPPSPKRIESIARKASDNAAALTDTEDKIVADAALEAAASFVIEEQERAESRAFSAAIAADGGAAIDAELSRAFEEEQAQLGETMEVVTLAALRAVHVHEAQVPAMTLSHSFSFYTYFFRTLFSHHPTQ